MNAHITRDWRNFKPSQGMGQDVRKSTFTNGEASSDSLKGKNVVKEYTTGKPSRGKGGSGGLNTNS